MGTYSPPPRVHRDSVDSPVSVSSTRPQTLSLSHTCAYAPGMSVEGALRTIVRHTSPTLKWEAPRSHKKNTLPTKLKYTPKKIQNKNRKNTKTIKPSKQTRQHKTDAPPPPLPRHQRFESKRECVGMESRGGKKRKKGTNTNKNRTEQTKITTNSQHNKQTTSIPTPKSPTPCPPLTPILESSTANPIMSA